MSIHENNSSENHTLAILAFHKIGKPAPDGWNSWFYIGEDIFADYLMYLRENEWKVIDIHMFLKGLRDPDILPRRSALLTFDDGYRSVREYALPVLRQFGYPGIVFVPTDYIARYNTFDDGIEPKEAICDWDDMQELLQHGIAIQSHGASHRRFSELSDRDQRDELMRSKAVLENNLGFPVEVMAFPYGDAGMYQGKTAKCLKETGYRAACLYGGNQFLLPPMNPYGLSRIAMGPDTDLEELLLKSGHTTKRETTE